MRLNDLTVINKLILILLIGIYAVVSYWMLRPYTVGIVKEPMRVVNAGKTIRAGSVLFYEMDMEKLLPLAALISKQVIGKDGGAVVTIAPVIGNLGTGKFKKLFPALIPNYTPEGEYVLKWQGDYKVNPLRTVSIIVHSEPFWVVKP